MLYCIFLDDKKKSLKAFQFVHCRPNNTVHISTIQLSHQIFFESTDGWIPQIWRAHYTEFQFQIIAITD